MLSLFDELSKFSLYFRDFCLILRRLNLHTPRGGLLRNVKIPRLTEIRRPSIVLF